MKISDLENIYYAWLKDSFFYDSIKEDPEDEFNVVICSKFEENMDIYLDVMNFWGVRSRPDEFYDSLLNFYPEDKIDHLESVTNDNFYKLLKEFKTKDLTLINKKSIEFRCLECFIWSYKKIPKDEIKWTTSDLAKYNLVSFFKYIYEDNSDFKWDTKTTSVAAENGCLECLKYAYSMEFIWDPDTIKSAYLNGHLDCLKFIHEVYCDVFLETTSSGIQPILHYFGLPMVTKFKLKEFKWPFYMCSKYNKTEYLSNVNCLEYIIKNGYYYQDAFVQSIEYNRVDLLQYLLTSNKPQDSSLILDAFILKSMECLKYLINFFKNSAYNDVTERLSMCIFKTTNEEYLNMLLELGALPKESHAHHFLVKKDFNLFKILINHGCNYSRNVILEVIKTKNLDLFKFLNYSGCIMNSWMYRCVIQQDSIEFLRYLHENNVPYEGLYNKSYLLSLCNSQECEKYIIESM